MDSFALESDTGNFEPDFTWKISGLREKLKTLKDDLTKMIRSEMESEEFQWSGYPEIRTRAKMHLEENGLAYLSLRLDEENQAKVLALGPNPSVYYVLRDRSGKENVRHISASQNQFSSPTFHFSRNYYETAIYAFWLHGPWYNADDALVIDVHVERPEVAQRAHSRDGRLECVCDNYRERKRMSEDSFCWSHQSPYFYTKGPKGHRMQLHLALNGFEGRDRGGLTACLSFLRGELDDDLPVTFAHKTTITLFNRKDPTRNVTKTVEGVIERGGYHVMDVCSGREVPSVLTDDAIAYDVTVQPQIEETNSGEGYCHIL